VLGDALPARGGDLAVQDVCILADSFGVVNRGTRVDFDLNSFSLLIERYVQQRVGTQRTHASSTPSSTGSVEMCACISSRAFALVVLSRFDRFLKSTFRLASDIAERSGGSDT
jgi:hypothetical protein